jgi:hypothetical protein
MTRHAPAHAAAVALLMLRFVSPGLLAQNSASSPDRAAAGAQIADFRGIWEEENPMQARPLRLLIVQNKSTISVYPSHTQEFEGDGYTATIDQNQATWSSNQGCVARFWKRGYKYDNAGFNTFRLLLQETSLIYDQETHWLVPCDGHPVGVERVSRKLWKTREALGLPLEFDPSRPNPEAPDAQSTGFSGFWIQDHAEERPRAMRLHIVQNASTLTVWMSYTQKFSDPGYTATINQDEATWKEPQGCAEQFRRLPGYNYDNPGFKTFRLRLQGTTLEYERETHWLVPCIGHPVGVETTTKELWRTSEPLTRPE